MSSVDSLTDEMASNWISQNIAKSIPDSEKARLKGRKLSLDLSKVPSLVDANLIQLSGFHTTSLTLSGQRYLTDKAMKVIGTFPELQKLSLAKLLTVTEEGLCEVAKATTLKELDLSYCNQIRDLAALLNLKKLEVLDISFCPKLNDQSISTLQSLPLKSLKMQSCFGLSSKALTYLGSIKTLQTLDITGNIGFSSERVQEFMHNNPHVQIIK